MKQIDLLVTDHENREWIVSPSKTNELSRSKEKGEEKVKRQKTLEISC